jgi:hypothetical protein
MGFSVKQNLARSVEIFYRPSLSLNIIDNFAAIERDLSISQKAKEIFSKAAVLSVIGGATALYLASIPTASAYGIVFLISVVAAYRFSTFINNITAQHAYRHHIEFILRKLSAVTVDWGQGVPDITKYPIVTDPNADITENFNNLERICERMPHTYIDPRMGDESPFPGVPHAIVMRPSYFYDETVLL